MNNINENIEITGNEKWGEARSFPGLTPPNDAVEVLRKKTKNDTYIYYKDEDGNLYYNTKSTIAFELEMRERKRVGNIIKGRR